MSNPAGEVQAARPPRRSIFKGKFLIVSIAFHVLLALVATYLVVQTFKPRKQTFKPPATAANPNQAVEHRVQVAKKQQSMSAPPMKRIATTGVSKVVLPAMPDAPVPTQAPGAMQGLGAMGSGSGITGVPGNPGGGGGIPLFGARDPGKGLAGTFYDIKQTKNGKPNDFAIVGEFRSAEENKVNSVYKSIIAKLRQSGLSKNTLSRYFVGPVELYTPQIFIPLINADKAPEAFGLKGKVEPRRWIVIYEGRVTPPESGRYTFVGNADDVIAVKFNNRMVLGGGTSAGTTKKKYVYAPSPGFSIAMVGDTVSVTGGTSYPISIAIGEIPGGAFGAYLLLQKEGVEYQKDKTGNPILPVLKFAPGPAPAPGRNLPPIAPNASWSVWKTAPAVPKPAAEVLP